MKISFVSLGLVLASVSIASAAEFGNVSYRQLWPFSRNVEVRFTASGVSDAQLLKMQVSEGSLALGTVPAAAYRGTSGVVDANGEYVMEFDPSAVPCLAARGMLKDLKIAISSSRLDLSDALYQIFDLTKTAGTPGARDYVTREALTGGVWGAWEETIWTTNTVTVRTPVWTGVTNDTKYALTHLVMRRIDAGSFNMGFAESADVGKDTSKNYAQRTVTITKPYYIGVYEFTAKQVRLLSGSDIQGNFMKPTVNDTFDEIRGAYTTAGGPYDWPTDQTVDPNSYIGKLRVRTGVAFDLPTEAQWEKAARAGSDGVYYDGCLETHKDQRNAIAWTDSNTSYLWNPRVRDVGQLKPNNYGLYDTLGNAWEWVLDWQAGGTFALQTTDPVGASAAGARYWSDAGFPKRVVRGASVANAWDRVSLHERTQNPVNGKDPGYGWRVAMPAE